jgi:hypothetical protein
MYLWFQYWKGEGRPRAPVVPGQVYNTGARASTFIIF